MVFGVHGPAAGSAHNLYEVQYMAVCFLPRACPVLSSRTPLEATVARQFQPRQASTSYCTRPSRRHYEYVQYEESLTRPFRHPRHLCWSLVTGLPVKRIALSRIGATLGSSLSWCLLVPSIVVHALFYVLRVRTCPTERACLPEARTATNDNRERQVPTRSAEGL